MPRTKKEKKVDEIAELSESMLRVLGSLRRQGDGLYPPTLRRLAEESGASPTPEQIVKAVRKTTFKAQAVVPRNVDRKPSLDSPVYFNDDAPAKKVVPKRAPAVKKDDVPELAARMLLVLEAQRSLGEGAYPPTLGRLAELCELNASDARVTKAAGHGAMTEKAIVAAKAKGGKPALDAPVVLKEDIDEPATLSALLRFALQPVVNVTRGKSTETDAFTAAELKKRLVPALQGPIGGALDRGFARRELPQGIAWVMIKSNPLFFLAENVRPAPTGRPDETTPIPKAVAAAAPPFEDAFRAAFDQLDRRNGSTNFVKLSDLRRALAGFGREEFDAGLRALRLDDQFSLDSHEGLHGSLTTEERDAGVRESGSLLIYVSRS